MLAFIQACMHVDRVLVFVIERQALHKREMFRWKLLLKHAPHLFQIRFRFDTHVLECVLLKRSLATRDRRQPDRSVAVEKVHQHLFVIAAQTNDSFRVLAPKFEYVVHTTRRVGATMDQVAKKNQRVGSRISRQHIEQIEELRASAMYVANDKSFHTVWSLAAGFLFLIPAINSTKRGSSCMSVQFGSDSNQR